MFDKRLEILLVEDNAGDVRLTEEVLKDAGVDHHLSVVDDGAQAIDFLLRHPPFTDAPRPDLMLLDLNLPKLDGREVLRRIKATPSLLGIPVVVLTTSQADEDVVRAYQLHAKCYMMKPIDLSQFLDVIKAVEEFWLNPRKPPKRD